MSNSKEAVLTSSLCLAPMPAVPRVEGNISDGVIALSRATRIRKSEAFQRRLAETREQRERSRSQRELRRYLRQQERRVNKAGYIQVYDPSRGRYIFEHRLVVEHHLGRQLYPGENVHHKNGVKHDNRMQNLELWAVSQPYGQRVEDLVLWAVELLTKYQPELLEDGK